MLLGGFCSLGGEEEQQGVQQVQIQLLINILPDVPRKYLAYSVISQQLDRIGSEIRLTFQTHADDAVEYTQGRFLETNPNGVRVDVVEELIQDGQLLHY